MALLRAFWNSWNSLHPVLPSFGLFSFTYPGCHSFTSPISAMFIPGLYPAAVYSLGAWTWGREPSDLRECCFCPSCPSLSFLHPLSCLCSVTGLMRFWGAEADCIPCGPSPHWVLQYRLLTTGRAFRWQLAHSSTSWRATCWKLWTLPLRPARPGTWPSSLAWRDWGGWWWWGSGYSEGTQVLGGWEPGHQ